MLTGMNAALTDMNARQPTSSSWTAPRQSEWKTLWNLPIPGKVLMFLWHLAHNSLPTRMNIKRKRHVELDNLCQMCSMLDEDGGHLFLRCKKVEAIWREQGLEDVRLKLCECLDPKEVLLKLLEMPPKKFQFCRRQCNTVAQVLAQFGSKASVCTPFYVG